MAQKQDNFVGLAQGFSETKSTLTQGPLAFALLFEELVSSLNAQLDRVRDRCDLCAVSAIPNARIPVGPCVLHGAMTGVQL